MKCYLTFHLMQELIFGDPVRAKEIEKALTILLKKETPLYTSALALDRLLEQEKDHLHSEIILAQSEILFNEIFSFTTEDLRLGICLAKEYSGNLADFFELALCINSGMELIIDATDLLKIQKMISVRNLCTEGM